MCTHTPTHNSSTTKNPPRQYAHECVCVCVWVWVCVGVCVCVCAPLKLAESVEEDSADHKFACSKLGTKLVVN